MDRAAERTDVLVPCGAGAGEPARRPVLSCARVVGRARRIIRASREFPPRSAASRSAAPVTDAWHAATASGVPIGHHAAALRRRCPGPRSTTQSATLIDVEVVLDRDDGVAPFDQAVEGGEQQRDVGRVEAGGRLVEQVERAAGAGPRQLGRELHPLRLAAGEHGRRMAERQVAEAEGATSPQRCARCAGWSAKNAAASAMDISSTSWMVLAAVRHRERLVVEPPAAARVAHDGDRAEELHADLLHAGALARLAAAALHVEGEAPLAEAAADGVGLCGEQVAHVVEQPGVGGRVRARRAADGRLIDLDDLVDRSGDAGDRCAAPPTPSGVASSTSVDLPAPDTPVTTLSAPSRKVAATAAQVVPRDAGDDERPGAVAPSRRDRDPLASRQERARAAGVESRAASRRRARPGGGRRDERGRRPAERAPRRPPRPRRGRRRRSSRRRESSARRARRRARCCRGRGSHAGRRAAGAVSRGAGRSTARRGRRARRPGRCPPAAPAGCAGPRRPTAWSTRGRASGSRAQALQRLARAITCAATAPSTALCADGRPVTSVAWPKNRSARRSTARPPRRSSGRAR